MLHIKYECQDVEHIVAVLLWYPNSLIKFEVPIRCFTPISIWFRWIDYGKKSVLCMCERDTVRICMEPFVKLFQSTDDYAEYKAACMRKVDTSTGRCLDSFTNEVILYYF